MPLVLLTRTEQALSIAYLNASRHQNFCCSYARVVHRFEGQNIFMILDNYSVHKTKAVERFLERHPRLQLLFLPTYSPDENQPGLFKPFYHPTDPAAGKDTPCSQTLNPHAVVFIPRKT